VQSKRYMVKLKRRYAVGTASAHFSQTNGWHPMFVRTWIMSKDTLSDPRNQLLCVKCGLPLRECTCNPPKPPVGIALMPVQRDYSFQGVVTTHYSSLPKGHAILV
jgi:hypothetical protein